MRGGVRGAEEGESDVGAWLKLGVSGGGGAREGENEQIDLLSAFGGGEDMRGEGGEGFHAHCFFSSWTWLCLRGRVEGKGKGSEGGVNFASGSTNTSLNINLVSDGTNHSVLSQWEWNRYEYLQKQPSHTFQE